MNLIGLHEEFGAEVSGVDLSRPVPEDLLAALDSALNRHSMLLFREQDMDDTRHLALTGLFGDLEEEHVSYYGAGEITYIGLVGNVDSRGNRTPGRRVRSQTGNQMWHSDSSFREIPSMYSILCAYQVPGQGGETEFASGRSAWTRLDRRAQEMMLPLVGIHDYIYSRTKIGEDAVNASQRTYMRPVRQRLVRKNPVTGERNLYGGSHLRQIETLDNGRSRELIDGIMNEITRPESVYRHDWKAGDVMIWDNRCLLHRGCGYDADRYLRRMHQTRVRCRGTSLAEEV